MIRLSSVDISEKAIESVVSLLRRGAIGQSEIIDEFERAFAKWLGVKYCVAVSSGTMADTIALAVLKHHFSNKKKVVVPAHTFIAQVNSITYNGLEPVFIDGPNGCVGVDGKDVLCFFPVHLLGKPWRHDLCGVVPVIEDSCEAMGSMVDGIKCGSKCDMGTFSFFPSHTITTGEGGMISTNNEEYASLAKRLRNHGKVNSYDFEFDVIGFNAKLTSIQAAIGLEALRGIDTVIQKRRGAFFALGGEEDADEFISPHAFPVICKSKEERDLVLKRLRENGIECRNLFSSIPTQEKAYSHLGYKLGDFPFAEEIGRNGLYVPCHSGLSGEDINKIKSIIHEA